MEHKSGIRSRWLTNYISVMVLLIVVLAAAAAFGISAYFYSCMRNGLEAKIQTISDFFEDYVSDSEDQFYEGIYSFVESYDEKDSLELEYINTDSEIRCSSFGFTAGSRIETADVTSALDTQEMSAYRGYDAETGEHIMAVSAPVYYNGVPAGVLRVVTSLKTADRKALGALVVILLAALIAVILVWLTGMFFIHSIMAPVVEITDTAKRIAAGGYGTQITRPYGEKKDEIGELTRTINNLSLQISQTEKMQTEFLSSISHELRTPLTAISGWGETLIGSEEMNPEDTRRGIVTMLKETKRLTSLVEEILEFSRIQDGRFKLTVELCDLRSVFEDTIFMYGSRLKQDGIMLDYDYNDDDIPEIRCDSERMKQVFLNILDNAAKYGGEGGRVTCRLFVDEENNALSVVIRDYGPGIPEDELPLVKKKFYRGTSKARGSGIGLAVCEEIVSMHGGELIIANAQDEDGGCEVTIRLPY